MKKIILIPVILAVAIVLSNIFVIGAEYTGGGGSFGSSQKEQEQQDEEYTEQDAEEMFITLLQYLLFGGTSITAYIVYERKLSKSARASKRIMNMLDQKDSAWKFKNIMPRFKQIFNIVKNAWSQADLSAAQEYTTYQMSEKLKTQLAWSDIRHQSHSLKHIKLLDARPVGVFDSHDDACDHIWFYVEWSAFENVDKYNNSMVYKKHKEFWQLMRCRETWVLSDIVDQETGNMLVFGEEAQSQSNKVE